MQPLESLRKTGRNYWTDDHQEWKSGVRCYRNVDGLRATRSTSFSHTYPLRCALGCRIPMKPGHPPIICQPEALFAVILTVR